MGRRTQAGKKKNICLHTSQTSEGYHIPPPTKKQSIFDAKLLGYIVILVGFNFIFCWFINHPFFAWAHALGLSIPPLRIEFFGSLSVQQSKSVSIANKYRFNKKLSTKRHSSTRSIIDQLNQP